jgi:hypothetical protein
MARRRRERFRKAGCEQIEGNASNRKKQIFVVNKVNAFRRLRAEEQLSCPQAQECLKSLMLTNYFFIFKPDISR